MEREKNTITITELCDRLDACNKMMDEQEKVMHSITKTLDSIEKHLVLVEEDNKQAA